MPDLERKFEDRSWEGCAFAPYQLAADLLHCRTFGHAMTVRESEQLDEQIRQLALNVKHGTRGSVYL